LFGLVGQTDGNTPDVANSPAERFIVFYREYLPKIFKYMTYKVADVHTAEDLTSLVFEKALNKFQSHDSEKGSFATWIFAIAHNTVVDHYRATDKEKNQQYLAEFSSLGDCISPEDKLIETEKFKLLHICISFLSRHQQEIISLKFGARMNNRQIAKMTGLSESNIGTTIWRTVSKLRDCFRERGDG
jgi:RNA polymerase sigma factor (sigma-70 family)